MLYTTVTLVLTLVQLVSQVHGQGSCRQAGLCCPGRDSSCLIQNSKLNEIAEDPNERTCFCDHACMTLGDCCYDYKETCAVIDCQVSEWEQWSDCDNKCGSGAMFRSRRIIREPQNGGKECPELKQNRVCHGHQCETKATAKASRESALILPSTFANTRTVNVTEDIRKNLRLRYPKDPMKENSHEYCVVFEITKARKVCEGLQGVASQLVAGSSVCVACEEAAMRKHLDYRCIGHGAEGYQTRWTMLNVPNCHGRWIQKARHSQCPCHSSGHPDFIFV